MKILAFEFSSAQRSVAVVCQNRPTGPPAIAEMTTVADTTRPLEMVESALRQIGTEREQIECLAIGMGPGSYTGIRAAIALAQGWQLALGTKLLGISSADAIAAQAQAEGFRGPLSVVIDAQRDEIYLADYEISAAGFNLVSPLRIASPGEAQARLDAGSAVMGPEVTRWFPAARTMFPSAGTVGRLALGRSDFITGDQLEPIYLRDAKFVKAPPPRVFPP